MKDNENVEEKLKVIDKRRFQDNSNSSEQIINTQVNTHQGSNMDSCTSASSNSQVSTQKTTNLTGQEKTPKSDISNNIEPQPDINFPAFLMGMYTQTLIFLGEIPHPESNTVTKHLDAAKQNIDILHVIEDKTRGNLSSEEEHLFKEILTTLRLQFVKTSGK
ncbi:MAG TPA: DUF1844 domain-containing protein [Oligoflexia bacterium]|nr:DUF1844 domain-containing protein [Oligoflexia bacterium]HMP48656.1 DUF1844 domain-containing protein [Oligoflexia bacterium]